MADLIFPSAIIPRDTTLRPLANVGAFPSPLTGGTRTIDRSGARWQMSVQLPPQKTNAAIARAFYADLLGGDSRLYMHDHSNVRRGTFPTGELLTNNTFANGTTGWNPNSPGAVLTSADRVLRVSADLGGGQPLAYQNIVLTQYVPYAMRAFIKEGRDTAGTRIGPFLEGGLSNDYSTSRGLRTAVVVPFSGVANTQGFELIETSGYGSGAYYEVPYTSLSRCALVDNGPNIFTFSDALDNAAWGKTRCSINANADTAPDGTTTADQIIEDSTASDSHFVTRTGVTVASSALDVSIFGDFKQNSRSACWLCINHAGGDLLGHFNLATGVVGATSSGTDWANVRSFIVDKGNGWYRCYVIGRKTGTQTSLNFQYGISNPVGTRLYTGNGSGNIRATTLGGSFSSVPNRPAQTTSSALTSGTSQTGSALYLKGLPASTNGLLEIDDQVEIITSRGSELKLVTARLNSDAAGLGYLKFKPSLRGSPADNAPVIIHQPMGKWLVTNPQTGWTNKPGRYIEPEVLELLEDISPA